VTVDGRLLKASESSNSDLFWAIRGGGGNFGVVTEFEYQLHPVDRVLSGALTYPAGRIPELLEGFDKFLAAAPDEMDAFAQLLPSEKGRSLKIDVCHCGDEEIGKGLLNPSALSIQTRIPSGRCHTSRLKLRVDFLRRQLLTSKPISSFES
jgi:hypothetical protein